MDGLGRRFKEQSTASSEDSSDPHERQDPSTLASHQCSDRADEDGSQTLSSLPLSQTMDAIMADEMSVKSTSPWPALDPMMPHMPGVDALPSNPDPSPFPISQGCTCNGMTGPCARHLEEIQFQVLNTAMTATPRFMSPFAKSHAGSTQYESSLGLPAVGFEGSSSGVIDIPQQPQEVLHHRPSYHSLSRSTSISAPNPPYNSNNEPRPSHRYSNSSAAVSKRSAPSPLGSTGGASNTPPPSEDSTPSSNTVSSSSDPEVALNDSNINNNAATANTARFKTILEAVSAAGFPDFDRMVAAYYTTPFEKSSVPYMAQRASRGRRLAKVLKDVHESSSRWPRWEGRGFRESAMESAKTICVDEIEKVAQHLECTRASGDEGKSLSALNGLRIGNANASAMSVNGDSGEESRLLAQLTTLPEDVEGAMQDEAPYLWSLFTELAGPQGLYCDRVSQAALALLIDGRRTELNRIPTNFSHDMTTENR